MIGIVDYGAGNLMSVARAFRFLGFDVSVVDRKSDFEKVSKVVIPGVGSFGNAMRNLNDSDLAECILKWVEKGNPILGICLGMQIFFQESEESPGVKGLGLLKGMSIRFKTGKIPNMGWLETSFPSSDRKKWFYYVHSYFVEPGQSSIVKATAVYGESFTASVRSGNIFGVQFHPEKSGKDGLELLKEWGTA